MCRGTLGTDLLRLKWDHGAISMPQGLGRAVNRWLYIRVSVPFTTLEVDPQAQ